jgi:hypothetical protein
MTQSEEDRALVHDLLFGTDTYGKLFAERSFGRKGFIGSHRPGSKDIPNDAQPLDRYSGRDDL